MNENEKIQSFSEMVNAADKLSAPWKKFAIATLITTIITNLFWCIIVGMLVYFAYMTPTEVDVNQGQDYENQNQTQMYHYDEGATHGD